MDYFFEASGKIACLDGLAVVYRFKWYITKFKFRDICWDKEKVKKGIFDSIAIKDILVRFRLDQFYPIYVDSYNSYWMEDMLVNREEAISLAKAYFTKRVTSARLALNSVSPSPCIK